MRIEFSGDEMILVLVGMVRAVNPRMLREGPDGFTLDFESLNAKDELTGDEVLLLKLRAVMEAPAAPAAPAGEPPRREMDLSVAEGKRLADALKSLEGLGAWPQDVLALSRGLRKRLTAAV